MNLMFISNSLPGFKFLTTDGETCMKPPELRVSRLVELDLLSANDDLLIFLLLELDESGMSSVTKSVRITFKSTGESPSFTIVTFRFTNLPTGTVPASKTASQVFFK